MLIDKLKMPRPEDALPGRDEAMPVTEPHVVNGRPLRPPYSEGMQPATFGMGCFWGAERVFWQLPGIWITAAGYSGGYTPNPTYQEVCTGRTGHNEVVRVVFDPEEISYRELLKRFWENHDPTQGMRQGNDRGTQYRSGIYFHNDAQKLEAQASLREYQRALDERSYGRITTEIEPAGEFYFAETYHQQYLARNPGGYCGLGGTGIECPGR